MLWVSLTLYSLFPAHTARIHVPAYNSSLETYGGTHGRCEERRGSCSATRKRLHIMLDRLNSIFHFKVKIAVRASLIANFALAVLQSWNLSLR
jgi:hypothetical protein